MKEELVLSSQKDLLLVSMRSNPRSLKARSTQCMKRDQKRKNQLLDLVSMSHLKLLREVLPSV